MAGLINYWFLFIGGAGTPEVAIVAPEPTGDWEADIEASMIARTTSTLTAYRVSALVANKRI